MTKIEAIILIITHVISFGGGVFLAGYIDSQFPEQPTTEQHIGKQKIKGEGIKAIFENVFTNIKKRSKK